MLHIILPILTGAVIGYFTNYIAIKMLFRPRKAIYIGSFRLPFTPGVIPANQPRIAEAVGRAVSGSLVTSEDLCGRIRNSPLKKQAAQEAARRLCSSGLTIEDTRGLLPDLDGIRESLTSRLTEEILTAVRQAELAPVVEDICSSAFGSLLQHPLVSMFLSEDRLKALYSDADACIKQYAGEKGRPVLAQYISRRLESMGSVTLADGLASAGIGEADIAGIAETLLDRLIEAALPRFIDQLDIRGIVVDKIKAMDAAELEKLIMTVMKNELQAIVNLGAVIGAVIGIINIFT